MPRSATQIQTELDAWYAARLAATNGKSITIATSAGSRTLSQYDLSEINETISRLERELMGANNANQGVHNFAVANLNHDKNP
jgi:hypothetical protein